MKKLVAALTIIVLWVMPVYAQQTYRGHLTPDEIQRVKAVKELLDGIDKQTLWQTIADLEKSRHPYVDLEVKEAMAHAYTDIVHDYSVEDQKKKEWLYSMVCLNMAYLQFGGSNGPPGSTSSLNLLIRQELKKYLPSDLINRPGFIYSLS